MRWQRQATRGTDADALVQLSHLPGLVRSVRPPEFAGVTFHEVLARSALNHVPGSSPMPFSWTVNPYRGCSHACTYCFARRTHTYLDFDAGADFDREIVVKTNVAQILRRELAAPKWTREKVALGTNTDPYQRAEGRYALMPGIIDALADSGTPFSILTKGTVLARDLPRLIAADERVSVGLGVSLALLDHDLQATLEPGTPSPAARLTLIRRITAAGLPCGVLIAPLLPHLTDSREQISALIGELLAAGATGVTGIVLHLRPGAREWFFGWLRAHRPDLLGVYERLYARGATADRSYRSLIAQRVASVKAELGLLETATGIIRGGVPGDSEASFPAGSLPPFAGAPVPATPIAAEPALF